MTPKEKAKELVYKFDDTMEFSTPQRFAKNCALIAVDEMEEVYASALVALGYSKKEAEKFESAYLKQLRQEINNL